MPVWGNEEILSRWEKTFASFLPQWVCRGYWGRGQGSLLLCRFWVVFPRQREQICLKIGQSHSPQAWAGVGVG